MPSASVSATMLLLVWRPVYLSILLAHLGPVAAEHTMQSFLIRDIDPDVAHALPANASLPAHCLDLAQACTVEAALPPRYEALFRYYESKYSDCGDYGWTKTGSGSGSR